MTQEFYFDWYWDLQSSPQAIWPFASDTNRFNRDTGQPEIEMLDNVKGVKQVRMKLPIIQGGMGGGALRMDLPLFVWCAENLQQRSD